MTPEDMVPAEAVHIPAEAVKAAMGVQPEHGVGYVSRILAAAAPLIVADRDKELNAARDATDDEKWLLGQAELELRKLRAEVDRLTAERDAARFERDTEQEVKIRYRKALMQVAAGTSRDGGIARTALAGDTPGGSR